MIYSTIKSAAIIGGLLVVLAWMQHRDAVAAEHDAYVKALENIVTICTSPGDNVIYVEGELGFCGTSMSGIKL